MRRCANSETRPAADLKFGDTEWERAAALPLPAGVQAPPARSRRDIAGNGLSKLFLTIAAAFAEADRDRIRERIGQVKSDQKARDRYLSRKVPFGFRRVEGGELVPREAEQEAIWEIVSLLAQGKFGLSRAGVRSLRHICRFHTS